jgi:hypothetical protein
LFIFQLVPIQTFGGWDILQSRAIAIAPPARSSEVRGSMWGADRPSGRG